jgi:uncharacterized tellurite resistance protein B-like protein
MFEFLKSKMNLPNNDSYNNFQNNNYSPIENALSILLVDIARADDEFTENESSVITSLMKKYFNIDDEGIKTLIQAAEEYFKREDSIYEYTVVINESFSNENKYELLRDLWRLAFADKKMDVYEESMVKKIGGLLDVDYQAIINAKLYVKEELKL